MFAKRLRVAQTGAGLCLRHEVISPRPLLCPSGTTVSGFQTGEIRQVSSNKSEAVNRGMPSARGAPVLFDPGWSRHFKKEQPATGGLFLHTFPTRFLPCP